MVWCDLLIQRSQRHSHSHCDNDMSSQMIDHVRSQTLQPTHSHQCKKIAEDNEAVIRAFIN